MLWVTWRQHRGLLITILVAFVAAVVSMAICGLKIHHDYAMMRACRLGSAITVAALVITQLSAWFFTPFLTAEKLTAYSPTVFDTRGVSYAAWTLTAFCLGAFLGMLVRRVLPAMAITLPIFAGLAALTWFCLRGHYPVRTFWPMQVFEAGWLLLLSAALFTATVQLVRRRAA